MNYLIRNASPEDIKFLPDIEKEAARLFIKYGLEAGVFNDVSSISDLQAAQKNELLWIAEFKKKIIGFAFAEKISSGLVLLEIDVLPVFNQQGIGTALVRKVLANAQKKGFNRVFLTTFKEIPWNYPFYKKLGFKVVNSDKYEEDIIRIVDRENSAGLDKEKRVVMVYLL